MFLIKIVGDTTVNSQSGHYSSVCDLCETCDDIRTAIECRGAQGIDRLAGTDCKDISL